LRLAALSSSLSVAVSQSFVPVVSGMFYLVVDYVCVFKASALRREIRERGVNDTIDVVAEMRRTHATVMNTEKEQRKKAR